MRDTRMPDHEIHIPYETRDEIALILTCSKGSETKDNREKIANLLTKELNWHYIFQMAARHELVPLMYYNLQLLPPGSVPEDVLQHMNEIYLISVKQSMIQTRELLEVIELGKDHEIPIIPYKGTALSQQIYGDIGLRISSDIDIIVRRQDAFRAKALLISRGYTPEICLTPDQDNKFIQVRCEYDLHHQHRTTLDIHWQFIPYYYLDPFEEREIWSGLKVISLEGQDISVLAPEMLIVGLCIHGAKHQWKELKQIGDIAGIIASDKNINWELILKIAREKRIERIISLGLRLAEELMKADLPTIVSEYIRSDRVVQHLVSSSIDSIFTEKQNKGGDIQEVLYWLSVRECLWDRIRVVALLAFKPNHDDWAYISLPGSFSPLYYIIRPIRLAIEYGVKR